jgi:predicted RNA-binding Zn-ribbon protein involved in translation (DUF1610 family)
MSDYDPATDCDLCDHRPIEPRRIGWFCPSCGRSTLYRANDPKKPKE